MPPPSSQYWTNKRDARLTACVAQGMSRSQAAAAINAEFGTSYTRSAVSGRMDRLGLTTRPMSPGSPKRRRSPFWRPPAAKPDQATVSQPAIDPVPFLLLQDHHCRAIVEDHGADGLAMFCGATKLKGSSYCYEHHLRFTNRSSPQATQQRMKVSRWGTPVVSGEAPR